MALPTDKAASLSKEMQKSGLIGGLKVEKPMDLPSKTDLQEASEPEMNDPMDDLSAVMSDIDSKVPGLGRLVQELVERCMASKES